MSQSTSGCLHANNVENLYGYSLTLNNTVFYGCTSINTNGGAINSNGFPVNVYNSRFTNCLSDSIFTNNSAAQDYTVQGGSFINSSSSDDISGNVHDEDITCFVSNITTDCITEPYPTCPTIGQCISKFNATYVKVLGGNYECEGPFSSTNSRLYIDAFDEENRPVFTCSDDSVFLSISSVISISISNIIVKSQSTAGCIHVNSNDEIYGCDLSIRNMVFDGCSSNTNGGAINSIGQFPVYVYDSVFTNCSSSMNGGAIFTSSYVKIYNSSIKHSSAKLNGGAIYSYNSVDVLGGVFTENSAIQKGGAIYNIQIGVQAAYTNFTFNTANEGGAIATSSIGGIAAGRNEFTSNSANVSGGAIAFFDMYDAGTPNLYFYASTFTNNSAGHFGGAVFFPFDIFLGQYTIQGGSFINSSSHAMMYQQHAFPRAIMDQLQRYSCDDYRFLTGFDNIMISEYNGNVQEEYCLYTQAQMNSIYGIDSSDGNNWFDNIHHANFVTGIVLCCLVGLLSIVSFIVCIRNGFLQEQVDELLIALIQTHK
eukprot:gene18395-22016_t